jgi:hypothetical protein
VFVVAGDIGQPAVFFVVAKLTREVAKGICHLARWARSLTDTLVSGDPDLVGGWGAGDAPEGWRLRGASRSFAPTIGGQHG